MVVALVFLFGLFPSFLAAQQIPPVVINEIAWMGTPVEGVHSNQHWRHEWLELQNRTIDRTIVLDGWSIVLYRDEELYFQIPLSGKIVPDGYFLIGASDKIPGADLNYANLGGKFVNPGMRVVLKDSFGALVDEVDAKEGWQAGENKSKRTMERTISGWQTSAEVGGTPKQKNSTGLKEASLEENIFFANKKDPNESFSKESVFSFPVLVALLLALLSGAGVLGLRRLLLRLA